MGGLIGTLEESRKRRGAYLGVAEGREVGGLRKVTVREKVMPGNCVMDLK